VALIGIGLAVGLALIALVAAPVSCCAPTARKPIRSCRRRVSGLFGRCPHHGRHPGARMIRVLGGKGLLRRRVCDKCGQARRFHRMKDTGAPYLGCVSYPICKNPRMLADYRF
jgi:hypothetical protein